VFLDFPAYRIQNGGLDLDKNCPEPALSMFFNCLNTGIKFPWLLSKKRALYCVRALLVVAKDVEIDPVVKIVL